MATSVTTTSAATTPAVSSVSTTDTATTTASATTGLSTTSSISSASSTESASSVSYMQMAQDWIANAVNTIRDCLARLPFIGHLFARGNETSTTATSASTASTTTWTDAEILDMIRGQFAAAATTTGTTTATGTAVATVEADTINYLVGLFGQMSSPVAKIEAFQAVHASPNATDAIRGQFYTALPDGDDAADHTNATDLTKAGLRFHVWNANGQSDDGFGLDYGHRFFREAINPDVLRDALANLHHVVSAAAASSTSATTSATSTSTAATGSTSATTSATSGTTTTTTTP